MLGGKRSAMLVRQLLGVKADAEAMHGRSLEQALDLVRSEGDGVAKGIDTGRELLLRDFGDQLVDDLADIMRAAIALVGGKCVEREQGRNDPDRFGLA